MIHGGVLIKMKREQNTGRNLKDTLSYFALSNMSQTVIFETILADGDIWIENVQSC